MFGFQFMEVVSMKKSLKVLCGIIIILIVLILIFTIRYFLDPSYDKSELYTKEMVQELLNKRFNLTNVYARYEKEIKIGDSDNYTLYSEFFIKDNMAKVISTTENGKKKIFEEDKNLGKIVWIHETSENIMILNDEKMGAFYSIFHYDLSNLEDYISLDFLGETEIEGRNNIVVRLIEKDSFPTKKDIVYIDIGTGLISKHVIKTLFTYTEDITEIKEGIVEDKDVKWIDYESEYPNYKVTETIV